MQYRRRPGGAPGSYERVFYSAAMRAEYREEPCRSALNRVRGMPFAWSLNPYMGCTHRCTFCYVRAFEARADRPSDDRYGRSIRVKVNIAEVLRRELARPGWRREEVAIGAATDPYQPAEGRYRLTRACLEALAGGATPFTLITRSPLVVRDLDVLREASRRARVSVSLSIPTLDPAIWRSTEPGTPPPHQRLRAIERLADAGVDAGVAVAPVLPGLSDRPEGLEAVFRAARDAGARSIWVGMLNLRAGTREHYLAALAADRPDLLPLYEELYGDRAYLAARDAAPVEAHVHALRRRYRLQPRDRPRPGPRPEPEQLSLLAPEGLPTGDVESLSHAGGDPLPARGRSRGRARGPAAVARARTAHPDRR